MPSLESKLLGSPIRPATGPNPGDHAVAYANVALSQHALPGLRTTIQRLTNPPNHRYIPTIQSVGLLIARLNTPSRLARTFALLQWYKLGGAPFSHGPGTHASHK